MQVDTMDWLWRRKGRKKNIVNRQRDKEKKAEENKLIYGKCFRYLNYQKKTTAFGGSLFGEKWLLWRVQECTCVL